MKHSRIKASVAALAVAALIGLSACGGSDGLSRADEEALQAEAAAAEEARQAAEEAQRQAEEAQRQAEEAKRQAEEEARRAAEEQRRAEEEARRAAEEQRRAEEEARRAAEEQRRTEEQRRAEEEARQAAEEEQKRLQQERDEAERAANRAQAKAAFDGLGGSADTGTRSDPGTVAVEPKYRALATVTTTPNVNFASKSLSSSGRWSITTQSNAGSTHNDDLVVYSDLGGPSRVLITEHSTYSGLFSAVANTNNIRASLATGNTHPIASSRFPGGGRSITFTHTIDSDPATDGSDGDGNTRNDYDTTRFSGTFGGASGTFECMDTCTVQHQGGSIYNLSSGTWTFTTSSTARVLVEDGSYMYFGWWKRMQLSDESFSFEMFHNGAYDVADIPDTLTDTATYSGAAVGQYAIYQPLGTQSETGAFTANAVLMADFGANNAEGTLSGKVTNFSNDSDWSITLNSQTIDGGAVADGTVSWTIAGNTENNSGMWDADFYSDVTPYVAHIPEGIAGTFDAKFDDVARLIGAFGAHCPTSTCPRN